jgi:hypothetical protein
MVSYPKFWMRSARSGERSLEENLQILGGVRQKVNPRSGFLGLRPCPVPSGSSRVSQESARGTQPDRIASKEMHVCLITYGRLDFGRCRAENENRPYPGFRLHRAGRNRAMFDRRCSMGMIFLTTGRSRGRGLLHPASSSPDRRPGATDGLLRATDECRSRHWKCDERSGRVNHDP